MKIKIRKIEKHKKIVISLCLLLPCLLCVLWCFVCFCTGHFVMVPINLTCPHCLQHFFFEHLLHLYFHCNMRYYWKKIGLPCLMHIHENKIFAVCMECNGIRYCVCRRCTNTWNGYYYTCSSISVRHWVLTSLGWQRGKTLRRFTFYFERKPKHTRQ